jgi:hypothetical protein
MTIRARRRVVQGSTLEEMDDEELQQIYFFGYVLAKDGAVTYRATSREEEYRAGALLEERGYWKRQRGPK